MNQLAQDTQFIFYILAGFVGLNILALVLLVQKHKAHGDTALILVARNFTITCLMISIMYSVSFYRMMVASAYSWFFLFRMMDISLFILMVLFWTKLIARLTDPGLEQNKRVHKLTSMICIILVLLSALNYGIFLDDDYYVKNATFLPYVTAIQVLVCIMLTSITLVNMLLCVLRANNRSDAFFIIAGSILLTGNGLWNGITVIGLFHGKNSLGTMFYSDYDPSSLLFLATNALTLFFIYRRDFSPIYFQSRNDAFTESFILQIQKISDEFGLTEREREVVSYVYQGYHNPEIAAKLNLSKYTIRNHLHNAFEKMDVNDRIEMLHFLNQYKSR